MPVGPKEYPTGACCQLGPLPEVRGKFPTRDEDLALIALAQSGDERARNRLLEVHSRFLWDRAIEFARGSRRYDGEELIGVACEAFIKAINTFKPDRGFRLTTLAGRVIWACLFRFQVIDRSTIRVPIESRKQRDSTSDSLRAQKDAARRPMESLSSPHGGLDIPEDRQESPFSTVIPCSVKNLRDAIKRLPTRQKQVIKGRLQGLLQHEIAANLGISKQRVQQIEATAKSMLCDLLRRQK